MAQKKGLIYRLTMGKDNLPDFTPDKLPGTRFGLFKDIFFGRFGALVKINLLTLLFCLPAIAWVVIMMMIKQADASLLPYSGNIGIGYPITGDVTGLGEARAFSYDLQTYLVLIPLVVIAGVGLSGAFYVMRRLVWGEGVGVAGHFFRGIKKNFFPFLWSSLIMGISLFIVMANIGIYNHMSNIHVALRVLGIVVSIIQFYFIVSMILFITTQAVTYKLRTWALIKNSFLFSIALLPQNLIILLLSALPILLLILLPSIVRVLLLGIFIFFGFSYIMLVWTVYAHWAYDRFINDRVAGAVKNRNMYVKTEQDAKAQQERDRKNKNIRFNNPKKRPKKITSIDEGETFTPLPTSFSRADLLKLQEEKENVKRSIDAEYEDIDEPDSESEYEDEQSENVAAETAENAQSESVAAETAENAQSENAAAEAEEPTAGEESEE